MKYQTIYKAIEKIKYETITDRKNNLHDFWIILESKKNNKRIWITHDFCEKWSISTAQLDLPCNSREYSESWQHYYFKNIGDIAKFIEKEFCPL